MGCVRCAKVGRVGDSMAAHPSATRESQWRDARRRAVLDEELGRRIRARLRQRNAP